jgi:hypothetical protein
MSAMQANTTTRQRFIPIEKFRATYQHSGCQTQIVQKTGHSPWIALAGMRDFHAKRVKTTHGWPRFTRV